MYLQLKSVVDMFLQASELLDSEFEKKPIKNTRSKRSKRKDVAKLLKRLDFGIERKTTMKKRSKRSPRKNFANILKRLDLANENQVNDVQEQTKLPATFKEKIEQMEGSDVKLVIQKRLTESDLNPNSGRLSIPKGKIQEKNFLTQLEESSLDVREGKKKRILGMHVSVLCPNLKLSNNLCFKKWAMKTTKVYNITHGWSNLASENLLHVNNMVQLWSFRIHHKLYFALIKI